MNKLILLLGISLILGSCEKNILRGEGEIKTEIRDTDNFNAISVSGNAKVVVTQGSEFKVEIKGYANLLNYYSSRVSNKTLKLGYRDNVNVRNDNIEVFITMPELRGISVSGIANIDINGSFPEVPEMVAEISGSGNVDYNGTGSAQVFKLIISGSGEINAFDLLAKTVNVNISGNGTGRVFAEEKLNVEISGNAKVYYKGSPLINSNISGNGELIKN